MAVGSERQSGSFLVSDIIFLQKRDHLIDIVPDWVRTRETAEGFTINHYFTAHPEMVLGRAASESTQYGHQDYTVLPIEGADLAQQLHEAVGRIHGQIPEVEVPELGDEEEPVSEAAIPADPNVKNYSYTVVDGEVYFRENSIMVKPRLNATATARVIGMVELRDCVNRLIDLQMDDADALSIQAEQKKLNTLYDAFTARFGLISNRGNELAFSDDNSYYLLSSLEVLDEDGNLQRKADMFTKRTIQPHRAVTHVDTASEALAVSISEKARVDMPYMAQLTGKTEAELAAELRGIIFRVPNETDGAGGPQYAAADEYLSGNVRQKLVEAQRAADADPMYQDNVEALRQALPKDLDASEIDLRLGATWIDQKYIQQFMYEILQTPGYLRGRIRVLYSQFTVEWSVTNKTAIPYDDVAAYMNFGTERASAYRILEDTLNLRDVRIYDTIRDGDTERRVLNQKETTLAQQKQQALKDAFKDWIWKEPQRRQELVRSYNERFNAIRPREYDGKHIVFTGMNPEITLREHQRNAIAHILYGKNTLLAHEVGAGKTFEMVAAAMESKRLGLCRKSLFAVPNHLVEQWASEFLRLYPAANILVTTKKDFEARNRKRFCAKIATGDYDAVIMGHSQFERLPVSMARRERLIEEQIAEIEDGIAELEASGAERYTIKQLERMKKSLTVRLEKLHTTARKDSVVTFEQLGVDRLFVDEAHSYDRTLYVLANTVRHKEHDGRISRDNKTWARTIPIYEDPDAWGNDRNVEFVVDGHNPGLVDLFINAARHEYLLTQPLTKDDIRAEAARILSAFQAAREPNSPSGTHFMVQVSPDFLARANSKNQNRLVSMLPFRSLSISTLEGRKGVYVLITKDEDRAQSLRLRKPSVRKKLSETKAEPGHTDKKKVREQER